jgi:trehalose 6-phosphate phosphatase
VIGARSAAGESGLAEVIASPRRAVVAVDFDGTLAPIVERPADARPAPGAIDALSALAARVGVCAVVTGRGVDDLLDLSGLENVTGIVIVGHYGLEEWRDGRLTSPAQAPGVATARSRLPGLLADAPSGVHVEDKGHSLAVHTRPAADPNAALGSIRAPLQELADEAGLELVPGRMVLELRPKGTDKGNALRELVTQHSAASVIYIGDDLGDLAAFAAVEELRAEGCAGVTVAVAGADAPRQLAERADVTLPGPEAVVRFLSDLAAAIGDPG